jgi:hypothetical protein
MTKAGVRSRCPDRVLGLIPWYDETGDDGEHVLTSRQRSAVQAHAAQCPECRAEIDIISGAPFEVDVDLPDSDRVFAGITERIAAVERAEDSGTPRVVLTDRARRPGDLGRPRDSRGRSGSLPPCWPTGVTRSED